MRPRVRRSLIILIAIVVIVPLAFAIFIATYDWNRAKPLVVERASKSLGRAIAIAGDLEVHWHWRAQRQDGMTFSPGFDVSARGVRIDNPEWAKRERFVELEAVDAELRLLPLLARRLEIPSVRLVKPAIDLEQRKDGSNTWTLAPGDDEASAWKVDVGEIAFGSGEIRVSDAQRALDLHVDITALDAPIPFGQRVEGDDPSTRREVIRRVGRAAAERLRNAAQERGERREKSGRARPEPGPYAFSWKASGTMHGEKVVGDGRFGAVLSIRDPKPFPVRADVSVGATDIALTGTITDPTSPDAVDMRLWITGPSLKDLYAIAGIALPNTPPYATVGRLAGHFRPHRTALRYQDFTARVGGSDLAGTLTYRSEGETRPSLTGDVDSTLLQFRDLGSVIGADTSTARADGDPASAQPANRVLPAAPFNVEHWKAMDADVHFTGKRVVRDRDLPINDVDTHIRMQNAVLTLDPLTFGMAGGSVKSSLRIDANTSPPEGKASLEASGLELKRLFEKVNGLSDSLGKVGGDVKLAGRGKSLAAILGTSDGALRLLMTDGRVSETLMEEAGLNIANIAISKMKGDQPISIECAAAAFTVKDGVANSDLFVFDTENALIDIGGTIDLGDERVDLMLHPQTKGLRVFSLRSPLHVEGSFEHLDVSVDKKMLLARGGGALGLAIVATPLAALIPLVAPGGEEEAKSCAPLAQDLKAKGVKTDAPPTQLPAKATPSKKRAKG
ncbi:MAG: AsmA family protein [Rhodanobacteraceae bacterium]